MQREKTSQAFRDALQSKYRSSNACKHQRRKVVRTASAPRHALPAPAPKQTLPAPAGVVPSYRPLARDITSIGRGSTFKRHARDCLGFCVVSKHHASMKGDGDHKKSNFRGSDSFLSKLSTMEGQTLDCSTFGPIPVVSSDHSPTLCNDPPHFQHTRDTADFDIPWQPSTGVPTTRPKLDAELFEALSSVAERCDDAGDPFEPIPIDHCYAP